ncbi:cache domain-containing protein [Streptomyces gilvosporeus]|uniref:HAMP domain-containing protein n=1 Tax=Streptomyces gilvosporeus TaxID=553510 RepID=A0A1V0TLG3_9ACTN|nr:HAMP domain-containing protein [Streptomyces gilvosporeus]ARF53771.1 HAMP domain-containing protein [Streptomyces gilvosporeus]
MPLLGGVRPPIAALLCALLAVAAFFAFGLGTVHEEDVPQAVSDGERQIAADSAASVAASVNARAAALRRSAAAVTPTAHSTAAQILKTFLPDRLSARKPPQPLKSPRDGRPRLSGQSVRGGALLVPSTGKRLAVSGEAVPLTGVDVTDLARSGADDIMPRMVTEGTPEPRLLFFARVTVPTPGRNKDENADQPGDLAGKGPGARELLLVVSEKLPAPPVHGSGRTGQLVDGSGKVLAGTATDGQALAADAGDGALRAAVSAADSVPHAAGAAGSTLGDGHGGLRRVAGWASVAAADGKDETSDLGLTLLTFRDVPPAKGGPDHLRFALLGAGALLVIAALVTVGLGGIVQRPLLRLHLSAARLAKGAAVECPEARQELARPVPVPAFGELGRVGRALESIRRQLLGEAGPEPAPPAGRRPGVRSVVLACVLLIAIWGVPLLFMVNRVEAGKAVPAAAIADQQTRTEAAADRVRSILDQSYGDLTAVASAVSGQSPAQAADTLRRALAAHPKYRSVYALDRTGAIVTRVGNEPLRTVVHAPTGSGITQVNTSGRIPSIAAYAQIPPAKDAKAGAGGRPPAVLFAEIDVNALNSLLSRPGLGSVWLTDHKQRVLAASVGFQAFQPLPGQGFTRLAARTEAAPGGAGSPASAVVHAETTPGAGPSVAAAAPLAQTGPAAPLGWRVVSAEPAAALKLTAYQVQARTMLAGLLALTAGIACLGWLHIVVVRPLRALAGYAERLAGGDRRTVLYPVHHDECGSVTRSLELLRQALADRDRGVDRERGADRDRNGDRDRKGDRDPGGGADLATAPAQSSRRESAPRP